MLFTNYNGNVVVSSNAIYVNIQWFKYVYLFSFLINKRDTTFNKSRLVVIAVVGNVKI